MVWELKEALPCPMLFTVLHKKDGDAVRVENDRHFLRISTQSAFDDLSQVLEFDDITIAHSEEFLH